MFFMAYSAPEKRALSRSGHLIGHKLHHGSLSQGVEMEKHSEARRSPYCVRSGPI